MGWCCKPWSRFNEPLHQQYQPYITLLLSVVSRVLTDVARVGNYQPALRSHLSWLQPYQPILAFVSPVLAYFTGWFPVANVSQLLADVSWLLTYIATVESHFACANHGP
jgi:hypothetical protein